MSLTSTTRHRRGLPAAAAAAALLAATASACSNPNASSSGSSSGAQTITVAVTANPLMTTIENLTASGFEAGHPNIKVKFVTYDENTERADVEKDVAAHGGQYDVVMIGPNDIASWASNGWIDSLDSEVAADTSYDVGDLLPPIKDALSSKGHLYALPFYGESSFIMYNKKIFAADGLTMPAAPTWAQIEQLAAKADDTSKNVAGICLRGLTGWGDNLASLDTVINTMGGAWFDKNWNAELTSPATEAAVNFYVNLVKKYGEPGAGNDSFNQCLNIFEQGQAAMWYDATVGASTVDASGSPIAGDVGFAPAPVDKTKSSGWLWTWALALESSSKHQSAAEQFMNWATSKQYIAYDASKNGWAAVPPGTRTSTYQNPEYQKAAGAFANLTLQEIDSVNINQPGVAPQPVPGVQYVGIPEFEDFGQQVSAQITAAIDGQESVSQALTTSQQIAQQAVINAGYKS
ncbi:sugar ABC transporter substrate-binding protein [Actinospica sp. MGRD01-02]|uniref:Sugar ABC transporter substrate-binding protein n=1 Tax=Actinospica acidithermotolerans TaxID=2828514 RepID=A0A941IL61_9ACTN|nr:sugar ABC transporter substrate-binding protein [Actinospica acidithermotolerans]MBR7827321.1 sugar ABC transporter substrate-binding protein [Actinospica acidithermotolerans]